MRDLISQIDGISYSGKRVISGNPLPMTPIRYRNPRTGEVASLFHLDPICASLEYADGSRTAVLRDAFAREWERVE